MLIIYTLVQVKEHIPTLAEMGLQQLYPEDPVIGA